ncbi:MAG: napEPLD-B, partial [Chlamydiia bacterium]|nr:napEPLD-B [Chlamydiia bacterium]
MKFLVGPKFKKAESMPHFQKGRFYNPHELGKSRGLWNVLLWQMGCYNDKKSLVVPPKGFEYPQDAESAESQDTVQWLQHSTFLIQSQGVSILTDPVFAKRASPFSFLGPKRHIEPGISLHNLPPIQYVLISHNHYDHVDVEAVTYLIKKNPHIVFCVPLKLAPWFQKLGAKNIIELDWWESVTIHLSSSHTLTFSAVPAQHFSGRGICDRDATLWCGWVVELERDKSVRKIYFAGDTGYNSHDFKQIGAAFKEMDLSLIPIGSYSPRRFMAPVHVGPEESLLIHEEVRSKLSIAGHFATFQLADEPLSQP